MAGTWVLFQSTPPRGGATANIFTRYSPAFISIHAPARGGDVEVPLHDEHGLLFQSTPPRGGETPCPLAVSPPPGYFNPRPREGGRRGGGQLLHLSGEISIHAPARGGDSKDAQFYLRIFDKQVELLRFWGKMRGGCLRNPEKDRRFLGKSLANLPEISGHLDFAGA